MREGLSGVLGNKGQNSKGTREHEPILGNGGTRTTGGRVEGRGRW